MNGDVSADEDWAAYELVIQLDDGWALPWIIILPGPVTRPIVVSRKPGPCQSLAVDEIQNKIIGTVCHFTMIISGFLLRSSNGTGSPGKK